MMKKIVFTVLTLVLMLSLCACSKDSNPAPSSDPATPPDLTGEWKQINSNSDDAWQAATITGDTITINWVSDGGDTKSLYWAGTFTAPTTADEPYSWDSSNDKEQTSKALLASGDETKTFTYANGKLSYEASALGTTVTVKMEKVG